MLNKEKAKQIVKNFVHSYELPGDELVILDSETIERDWGWVFFYTSRKWHEKKDTKYSAVG